MRNLLLILVVLALGSVYACAQYKENGRNKIMESDSCISKGRTKDFLKEGTWKIYYPDGKLKFRGKYRQSNPQGVHVFYHHNGKISETRSYNNGKYEGPWMRFNERGDTTMYMNFVNGGVHGKYVHKSDDQNVVIRGQYVEGSMSGLWVTKNEIGIIDSINYVKGKKHGRALHYYNYKLYSICYYKNDQRDSTYSIYDENGRLKQEQKYKDGSLLSDARFYTDGVARETRYYNEDGSMNMMLMNFVNGSPRHQDWYGEDNQLDSTHEYVFGKLDKRIIYRRNSRGSAIQYMYFSYNCGQLFWMGYDDLSGRDSVHYKYYKDGALKSRMAVKNGEAHGRFTAFYPDGKIKLSAWMNGFVSFDSLRVYNEQGKVLKSGDERERIIDAVDLDDSYITFHPELNTDIPPEEEWESAIGTGDVDTMVYVVADIYPKFPGDTVRSYIQRNVRYPKSGIDVEGTVYVRFIVEKDGSLSNIEIAKEIHGHPEYSEEAKRVIAAMPKWIPGTVSGEPVRVSTVVPVRFAFD